jgi:hypothetical protein
MLYIVSQDKTHYSSSAVSLKGKEIYQDGIVIATYNDEEEARGWFDHLINSHHQQIMKEPLHEPSDCYYEMHEAKKIVVEKEEEKVEVATNATNATEKAVQEKKPQSKKVVK